MRTFRYVLLVVSMLLASTGQAPAQTIAPPEAGIVRFEHLSAGNLLAIAGRMIDAGRFDEAQALLDQLARDGVAGIEGEFLEGMIALTRRDYARAEASFRNILVRNPALVRVRLELARTLFLNRKDEQADYQFRLAIAEHPPEEVLRNAARFREAIRARRAWRFNLDLGLAPDTNINSATGKQQVEVLGLPFQLNDDARARSGVGLFTAADASVRIWRARRVPLYIGAYGRVLRYSDGRFSDVYLGGEAGPEFRLAGGRLRLAASVLERWYGGSPLVTTLGGRLKFDKVIAGSTSVEASLAIHNNRFNDRNDVNGWDVETSIGLNRAISASTSGFIWASAVRATAKDPGQSSWQGRAGFGLLREVRWALRPQLTVEIARQVNDAPLGLFGTRRMDWRLQASASIYKRDWNIRGFAPSLRITWTRSFSTITLYDQKRLRTELGVTKAF